MGPDPTLQALVNEVLHSGNFIAAHLIFTDQIAHIVARV